MIEEILDDFWAFESITFLDENLLFPSSFSSSSFFFACFLRRAHPPYIIIRAGRTVKVLISVIFFLSLPFFFFFLGTTWLLSLKSKSDHYDPPLKVVCSHPSLKERCK